MKLHTVLLEKFTDLPTRDAAELRHILDDLIGEVKDVQGAPGQEVFTVETLANRGDHLHTLGVAREFSARYLTALKSPALAALPERRSAVIIRKNTALCMRYALLELTLPHGMKLRPDIAAIIAPEGSVKPAIVDLLNYVQLELGQPMHAFDRDKIEAEIIIDTLSESATIEALDGKTYAVPPGSIVIRDRAKIVAVAGVIGCANSMVSDKTTRVLLESASFDPVQVRKTARAMGISTDASYAFERGCDVEAVVPALRRVVHLAEGAGGAVKEDAGAHVVGFTIAEGELIEKRRIESSFAIIRTQLNVPRLADVEISSRLKNLGFSVEPGADSNLFRIGVPSWRLWDVRSEEDVVEEVARSHGLARVKLELPALDFDPPEPDEMEQVRARIEPVLLGNGFIEVMTKSFYGSDDVAMLADLVPGLHERHVKVENAVERSYSHLKVSNIPHLARVAEMNHRRGVASVKIFEVCKIFSRSGDENGSNAPWDFERDVLCLAQSGRWFEHEWRKPEALEERIALFSGVLESLVEAFGQVPAVSASKEAFLHPGYQGALKAGRSIIGSFGLVHPRIGAAEGCSAALIYAHIDLHVVHGLIRQRALEMPCDFPVVWRDITLRIGVREFASRVARIVADCKPEHLSDVQIVDNFRRPEEDFRRLTVRLTFQNPERTLEAREVDKSMEDVLRKLRSDHGLELAA